MGLKAGTRFGPYEILGLLGAGGMGEVYRARDEKLGRDVAFKILPDAWLTDPDRRSRFDREARLLAQLNHPHVGSIYGFEERDGVSAIVLELVDGPTLAELLAQRKAASTERTSGLPLPDALKIGRQIAAALEATHERGIVHRDLKPANIKISRGGVVKVIDFGLARDASAGDPGNLAQTSADTVAATQIGVVLGTPGYMSPEQARGKVVDKRSDIWSFGCVLFEMLTGRSPFHGDSIADAFAAILSTEPDWRLLPRDTPPALDRLLRRCLEKDQSQRLRDIGDARLEFDAAEQPAAAAVKPASQAAARPWVTVVVLPFANLSSDPEQEYFSDGLMDETITAIGEMNPDHLRVVARTSSMAYKKTMKTVGQIGHELHADYLVESSVRREVNRVRITTQLIRVEDETRVWSARFDRTPESVLGLQDEISRAIAAEVHGKLSQRSTDRAPRQGTQNHEAHDLYLRGTYHWHRFEGRETVSWFNAAVEQDSSYALAHAGLALAYAMMPIGADAPPLECLDTFRHHSTKAVMLDPLLAEAQIAAGVGAFFLSWDFSAAERALRRALELNPNSTEARFYLGHVLSSSFQHDEAIAMIRHACELDPISAMMHSFHGQFLFDARRYAEAHEPIRRAIAIDGRFFHGHEIQSRLLLQERDLEGALSACENAYRLSGILFCFARTGYIFAKLGRLAEARQVLTQLQDIATQRFVAPLNFAVVHAGLGHREETLRCLEDAVTARAIHLVLLPTDPLWDEFRDEPRFRALSQRCGFRVNPP